MRFAKPTTDDTRFEEWMRDVDAIIASKLGGFDSNDLPDMCYRDWHEEGMTPKSAAARAIGRNTEEQV